MVITWYGNGTSYCNANIYLKVPVIINAVTSPCSQNTTDKILLLFIERISVLIKIVPDN